MQTHSMVRTQKNNVNEYFSIHTPMTESMFDGMVAVEEVDQDNLQKLINSDLLMQVQNKEFNNIMYDNEREQLKAFQQIVKDGYAYSVHTKTKLGRSSANDGLSLLNLRKVVRQTICCHDRVLDIDMDNAHPTIMLQILKENNIKHTALSDYVMNRKKYFATIYDHWELWNYAERMSIDELKCLPKTLMLRIMYGGSIQGWERGNKLKRKDTIPKIINDFIEEFQAISAIFRDENPELRELMESKKDFNIDGSITSIIMQQKESQILEVMTKYLIRRNYIETVKPGFYKYGPCADGLIIHKNRVASVDMLLTELRVEIFCKTGFIMNLSVKPMDKHVCDILDDHITKNEKGKYGGKVNSIINASDELYDKYANSKYYQECMERCDVNTRNVDLVYNRDDEIKCLLCNIVHKVNKQKLYHNMNGHACLSCHKKKIIIDRVDKKALAKASRDMGNTLIDEFYGVNDGMVDGVKLIEEDSRYLSCDVNNKFVWRPEYDNAFIVLDAQMGKGKTQFIKNFLNKNIKGSQNASILVVSQRKSFTHFICEELQEFNIKSYLEIKDNSHSQYNSICIQIESLMKVGLKTYDYIILDEVETILNQFSSTTMAYVTDNFNVLESLIAEAKCTILADAFITTRTMEYLKMVKTRRDNVTLLRNTKLFLESRKAIQIHGSEFINNVINALKAGKKIAVVSTSREDLNNVVSALYQNETTRYKNIKFYDRFKSKEDLNNVNESWADADCVCYTPVITTGISYTNQDHIFDTIYLNCKNTCQARDLMQMAMRICTLKDNEIYFALNSRQTFGVNDIMFKPFGDFMDHMNKRGEEMLKLTADSALKDRIKMCMKTYNPNFQKIMYCDMREQAISGKYFSQLCIYLLEKQGYDLVLLEDKAVDAKSEKLEFNYSERYDAISELDSTQVKVLKGKDNSQEAQMAIDKYYFENMLVRDLTSDIKSKLFFDYYQNIYKKGLLDNLRMEKNNVKFDRLMSKDLYKNDNLLNKLSLKALKLNHIKNMNKILSLKNSCQNEKVIKKDNKQVIQYLKKNVDSINTVFDTKYKFHPKNNVQNNLICFKMLAKIYGSWSGLKFHAHERTKKGTQSYVTQSDNLIDYIGVIPKHLTVEELYIGEED